MNTILVGYRFQPLRYNISDRCIMPQVRFNR